MTIDQSLQHPWIKVSILIIYIFLDFTTIKFRGDDRLPSFCLYLQTSLHFFLKNINSYIVKLRIISEISELFIVFMTTFSSYLYVLNGVPQGSVLGSLLFVLNIKNHDLFIILFTILSIKSHFMLMILWYTFLHLCHNRHSNWQQFFLLLFSLLFVMFGLTGIYRYMLNTYESSLCL